jgi:hypothetical protein
MNHTPYTYLLGWQDCDMWYYGVRYAKGCDPKDLLNPYVTSSKYVREQIKNYGYPDIVQIRKVFANKDNARRWEHKVLRRLRVVEKDHWINQTDNISISIEAARRGGIAPKSKEFSEAIRKSRLGKSTSEDVKTKISQSMTGKKGYWKGKSLSEEHKKKISSSSKNCCGEANNFFGKRHDEETKRLIGQKSGLSRLGKPRGKYKKHKTNLGE